MSLLETAFAECSLQLQAIVPRLPQNLMTLVFHLYASQELYQYGDAVHDQVSQLEDYFPQSLFLKTQRALLYYHSKGMLSASIFRTRTKQK